MTSGTFVYSPDIRVIVNSAGSTYDLSKDVESFSLTRRSSAVSSFTCTLNNQFRKYDNKLRRMSRIVVFLKRVTWVQVFAGYLDTVPFRTVVPKSVQLEASCTLKRLQYTQWDPTIPESVHILPSAANPMGFNVKDGGAAQGMYNVLTEVSKWKKEHIFIQKIPDDFLKFATELNESIEIDQTAIAYLQNMLSSAGFTGGVDPEMGSLPHNAQSGQTVEDADIARVAYNAGFRGKDLTDAVAVALAESGGDSSVVNENNNGTTDHGLWQINTVHESNGFDKVKARDPEYNAQWAKRIHQDANNRWTPWYAHTPLNKPYGSGAGYLRNLDRARAATATITPGDTRYDPNGGMTAQQADAARYGGQAASQLRIVIPVAGAQDGKDFTDTWGAGRSGGRGHKGVDIFATRGTPVIAAIGGEVIASTPDPGQSTLGGNRVWIRGTDGRYHYYAHLDTISVNRGQTVSTGQHLGTVGNTGSGARYTPPHLHYSVNTRGRAEDSNSINPYRFLVSGGAETVGSRGVTVAPDDGLSAFNIAYQPASLQASQLWAEDRFFMDAQPVLLSVQTLSKASLREFASSPTGDFVSWFPDWFGIWGGTPSMVIEDVELVDFSVSISDAPLTTHVGVAGDRTNFGTGVTTMDWVESKGIITIEQKEVMRLLMNLPLTEEYDDVDVARFLSTYGMRTLVEEMPILRDPLWETMYGLFRFMQQWTMQYRSPIQFTFMPEVWPGMRIELPSHDLQVYVESVTHSGSRSGGFRTTAEVSSPISIGRGMDPLDLVGP